ncbi:MAG: hypothetical protein A3I05_08970 [Deltaproteobacteria bacterium RIFCSPLOWO2_02_FULL_44_10]|nr:MAG: hypothetical protein A3C46_08645 [Deltaproteobacteria bacterium RIFCSPHIGHO2_02_FULL_44_16]OGQ45237.1 MAG: hypothetical protein A3I05_08970 [Deltaproteobacteria bacterium RIFCSPLOWO2_02_FULL_44_10]
MFASGEEKQSVKYKISLSNGERVAFQLLVASQGEKVAAYKALAIPGYTFGVSAYTDSLSYPLGLQKRFATVSILGEGVRIPKKISLTLRNITLLHLPLARAMYATSLDFNLGGNSMGAPLALTMALFLEREHPGATIDVAFDDPMSPEVLNDKKNWMFGLLAAEAQILSACGEGLCELPLWLSLNLSVTIPPLRDQLLSRFYGYENFFTGETVDAPKDLSEAYADIYRARVVSRNDYTAAETIYHIARVFDQWDELWIREFPAQVRTNEQGEIVAICLRGAALLTHMVGDHAFYDEAPVEWYRIRLANANCGEVTRIDVNGPHVETSPRMRALMERLWPNDMNP